MLDKTIAYEVLSCKVCRTKWENWMKKPDYIVVTFKLDEELYKKLCTRVHGYGDRSRMFRIIIEKFLAGDLQISIPERQL